MIRIGMGGAPAIAGVGGRAWGFGAGRRYYGHTPLGASRLERAAETTGLVNEPPAQNIRLVCPGSAFGNAIAVIDGRSGW